jgi:hypothetical protein
MKLNDLHEKALEIREYAGYEVIFVDDEGSKFSVDKIEWDKDENAVIIYGELESEEEEEEDEEEDDDELGSSQ